MGGLDPFLAHLTPSIECAPTCVGKLANHLGVLTKVEPYEVDVELYVRNCSSNKSRLERWSPVRVSVEGECLV